MGQQYTKDERYVICLYENMMKGEDKEALFNKYEIGHQIHLQERGVDAICKLLVQANFIKKGGEAEIYITPNGIALAERLLNE